MGPQVTCHVVYAGWLCRGHVVYAGRLCKGHVVYAGRLCRGHVTRVVMWSALYLFVRSRDGTRVGLKGYMGSAVTGLGVTGEG